MRLSTTILFAFLAFNALHVHAEPADVCVAVFEEAEQEQASIAAETAGRGVVGTGRVYFHTAPDKRCQLKNVFVVPGDRLEAYAVYGDFTNVIYWNSATGAGTAGWVLSSRLADVAIAVASAVAPR